MTNPVAEQALFADVNGNAMGGAQQANVADMAVSLTITWSSNDPGGTPNGAITVANGSSISNAEIAEFMEEVEAAFATITTQYNALKDIVEAHGLMAAS